MLKLPAHIKCHFSALCPPRKLIRAIDVACRVLCLFLENSCVWSLFLIKTSSAKCGGSVTGWLLQIFASASKKAGESVAGWVDALFWIGYTLGSYVIRRLFPDPRAAHSTVVCGSPGSNGAVCRSINVSEVSIFGLNRNWNFGSSWEKVVPLSGEFA